MAETITAMLRLVIEVLAAALRPATDLVGAATRSLFEVAPASDPHTGALVIAVAVVAALALVAVAVAVLFFPVPAIATAAHPRRAIADATRLTASHPDAPGHSRPRAPGSAALAA